MFKYSCLNPIAETGLEMFSDKYEKTENLEEADLVLVRSAKMTEMEIPSSVVAIGRAGAGVNNIPVQDCAANGVVVFNTPGANANGVKECCWHPVTSWAVLNGLSRTKMRQR